MPFYEYECRSCGREMTLLVLTPAEEKPTCEACGSARLRRLLSACNVRAAQTGNPDALREPRSWLDKPERFGEAMRALGEKTNVKFDPGALDGAIDRLKASRDGQGSA